MIVEYLTFTVSPADREAWIAADARTWTPFLARQPGFVSKSVWLNRDRPDEICAAIIWTDEASWKAIPAEQLRAVDRDMGDMVRPLRMDVFDVAAHTSSSPTDQDRAAPDR